MRRILLTGSALATGLLMSGTAFAEAPTVTFSGSTDYYLRVSDYDTPAGVAAPQNGPGWDINQETTASELIWDANATADNGLQFGANVQLRYAGGVTTDEAYVDFAGAWGTLIIGDDDGVVDNTEVSGVTVLPLGAYDTGRFTGATGTPAGFAAGSATAGIVGESSDASKVAYYSPSFAGFGAAVSATPDTSSTFGANNTGTAGTFHNVVEAALTYGGEFGGVGVNLSAGYVWGSTQGVGGASMEDVGAYQVGGAVTFAGFSVGMAYGDSDDSSCPTATPACDQGKFFNAGVAYNFGAGSVGVGYATQFDANVDGNALDDESEYWSVEGSYTIAQGLTGYGGVMFSNVDDGDLAVDVDSTIFVLGTRVNF